MLGELSTTLAVYPLTCPALSPETATVYGRLTQPCGVRPSKEVVVELFTLTLRSGGAVPSAAIAGARAVTPIRIAVTVIAMIRRITLGLSRRLPDTGIGQVGFRGRD
jgi:hypothetical protein